MLCFTSFCTGLVVSIPMEDFRRKNLVYSHFHNPCHPLKIISTANVFLSLSYNIQTDFRFLIKDTINKLLVTNILIPVRILWFHTWVAGPTDLCSGHLLGVSVIWFMVEDGLPNPVWSQFAWIKFYCNTVMLIRLYSVYGCVHTVTGLSGSITDLMAYKT